MTYQDKKFEEILNDNTYPNIEILNKLMDRIRKFSISVVENINDDSVSYKLRDMEFAKIIPEEEYVQVLINMPYERVVDYSKSCEVDPFKGRNGVDIVSFKVKNGLETQYGVSIAKQSYTYVKRLKI